MRNKHKFTAALLGLALAGTVAVSLAYAEDSTATPTDTKPKIGARIDAARQKVRVAKAQAISRIATNQLKRAQNAIDKLSSIIDRIKALRDKIKTTSTDTDNSTSTPSDSTVKAKTVDTAKLDALITTAQTQKDAAQKALDDVKAKADALQKALTTAASDTTNSSTVAPTHPVQDFMKSVVTLKKDLIALHKTLQQIVPVLKSANGEDKKPATTNTSNTSTDNAGEQEND